MGEWEKQELAQRIREKKHNIQRGNVIDFGYKCSGVVIGLYPHGICLRFGQINRFLTWWEFGKARNGEMLIALRD